MLTAVIASLQSIRRQRSSRNPSDTHSTDSGGDGGGPGRLLGAAAAEYTANLRLRRFGSITSEAEVSILICKNNVCDRL